MRGGWDLDALGNFFRRRCRRRRRRPRLRAGGLNPQEINLRWLQMKKMSYHEKLGLRSKTAGQSQVFDRKSQLVEEHLIEIGSMCGHFALCGSARGAI